MIRRGVIFDMDGVLVDSYDAHLHSWLRLAENHGLEMTEEDFARSFGRTSREIIREQWGARVQDSDIAAFDAEKEALYREVLLADFPEMDGADDLIAALHAAGFAIAIGSSGPRENIETVLQCLPHAGCITATVNGMDVRHGKPAPDVFLQAAGKLGVDPRLCAVVEDARHGVDAARRAGSLPIGITGTTDRAILEQFTPHVVDSLRELTPQDIARWIDENAGG